MLSSINRNQGWTIMLLLICSGILILSVVLALVVRYYTVGNERNFSRTESVAPPPSEMHSTVAATIAEFSDQISTKMGQLTAALNESTQVQKEFNRDLKDFNSKLMNLSLPPPAPQPLRRIKPPAIKPGMRYHIVREKETLYRIKLMYNTTIEKLCELNGMEPTDIIWVGQKIILP